MQKNIIKFILLALTICISSCTDNSTPTPSNNNDQALNKSSDILIDRASAIPVLNGMPTKVGLYVHNTTRHDISGIKYTVNNSESGNHLQVSDTSCTTIKAHDSCILSLTTPALKSLSGSSDIIQATYADKHTNQMINYKYVNTSQYDKVTFGGVSIELNGPHDFATVYAFAGGNHSFNDVSFQSSDNSVEIVDGLTDNHINIGTNEVIALEIVSNMNITSRIASITPVYSNTNANSITAASAYSSNGLDVAIDPVLRSPNLIMSNIPLLTVDNNHAVINVYNSGNDIANDIHLAVVSGEHINITNGETPCTSLDPQTTCQYNIELNGATTNGSTVIELSYGGSPHRQMVIYYQNNLGSPMLGMSVSSSVITESTAAPVEASFTIANYGGSELNNVAIGLTNHLSEVTSNIMENDCGSSIAIHQECHVKVTMLANNPKLDYDGVIYLSINGNDEQGNNYHFVSPPIAVILNSIAPKLVSVVPYDGSTGVSAYTGITLNFNREMDPLSFDNSVRLIDEAEDVTVPLTLQGVSNNNQTVSYVQASGHLDPHKTYVVAINPSAIRSQDGVAMDENSTESLSSVFATSDDVEPSIDTVVPSNGTTNISATPAMKIQFSEPMDSRTLNESSVMLVGLDSQLNQTPSSNNQNPRYSISYSPSDYSVEVTLVGGDRLASKRKYQLRLNKTLIKDAAGNRLGNDTNYVVSQFTTGDFIAPELVSVSPVNGATSVAVGTDIKLTFSEPMNSSTLNTNNIRLLNVATNQYATLGSASYNSTTYQVSLKPTANLADLRNYRIILNEPMIKDVAGNALGGTTSKTISSFITIYASNGFFILTDNSQLFSLEGNTYTNLTPTGSVAFTGTMRSVYFDKVNKVLFATGGNGIWRSLDYGRTWSIVYTNTNGQLIEGMTQSVNGTLIAISSRTIYRSTNGGSSWSINSTYDNQELTGIAYGNNMVMVVGRGMRIYRSLDNGASWSIARVGDPGTSGLYFMNVAYNSYNGMFIATGYYNWEPMLYTTTSGTNWVKNNPPSVVGRLSDIAISSTGAMMVIGCQINSCVAIGSTNGGTSWAQNTLPKSTGINFTLGFGKLVTDNTFVTFFNGNRYASTNNGSSWSASSYSYSGNARGLTDY